MDMASGLTAQARAALVAQLAEVTTKAAASLGSTLLAAGPGVGEHGRASTGGCCTLLLTGPAHTRLPLPSIGCAADAVAAAAGGGGMSAAVAGGLSTITAAAASVSHIRGVPTSCILIKNAFNPATETGPVRRVPSLHAAPCPP